MCSCEFGSDTCHGFRPFTVVTLKDFEIQLPPDIFHQSRSTLLVGNLTDHDETRFLGQLMQSPFGNLDNLDNLGFAEYNMTDHLVLVECGNEMKQIILNSPRVLLFDFTITCGYDPIPTGACQFRKGDFGTFIPWDNVITKQHWALDLFSGGYGGWKYGLNIVQQYLANFADELTYPKHCVIGIDSDLPSVTQSSVNHSTFLLPDQPIPNKFFLQNIQDTVIHSPIQSPNWKQSVALISPDWWTMSFPCQPSSSARSLGFGGSNGRSLGYAIGLLRVFRPRFCLLENVKGFAEHHQYPLAVKLFRWAGFLNCFIKVSMKHPFISPSRDRDFWQFWFVWRMKKDHFNGSIGGMDNQQIQKLGCFLPDYDG